jgi:hypothetical protein
MAGERERIIRSFLIIRDVLSRHGYERDVGSVDELITRVELDPDLDWLATNAYIWGGAESLYDVTFPDFLSASADEARDDQRAISSELRRIGRELISLGATHRGMVHTVEALDRELDTP